MNLIIQMLKQILGGTNKFALHSVVLVYCFQLIKNFYNQIIFFYFFRNIYLSPEDLFKEIAAYEDSESDPEHSGYDLVLLLS